MAAPYQRRWENRQERKRRSVSNQTEKSYYGLPVIHKPHWRWEIILYFFLGGISASTYVIATISRIFGRSEDQQITRTGYYISFITFLFCPVLLILDLGRPERFLNMLRTFKLRSPMSTGTWAIMGFGAVSTFSVIRQTVDDRLIRRPRFVVELIKRAPSRGISIIGGIPALFVSGYTGVLLAATAVPLWTKNYLLMGPLFAASAMSNGAASIALILSVSRHAQHGTLKKLERLDSIALLAELLMMMVYQAKLGPTIARPLRQGRLGRFYGIGVLGLGIVAPLTVQIRSVWFGRAPSRAVSAITSLLVLIGGFIFRYTMVLAGHESADDPEATFELTRRPDRDRQAGST